MNFESSKKIHTDHSPEKKTHSRETADPHKEENLASWEKIKKTQTEKDQEKINQIKQSLLNQPKQPEKNKVDYENLSNVKLCEKKLIALLSRHSEVNNFSDRAKETIYEMLTRRSEFVKNTTDAGRDAADLMSNYKPQAEWYRNTRGKIEQFIDNEKDFKWNSNPGWFGINTRPEAKKIDTVNLKAYATIPVSNYTFIQYLPNLAKELRQLSLVSDDIIQVKIPESLSGFVSHNDSIVIHFKKKENSTQILNILATWMQAHNITEEQREMQRTKLAADSKETSFSDLIARNIADWIKQNAGKYDNQLLAKEAVKHAIAQSQKSPF